MPEQKKSQRNRPQRAIFQLFGHGVITLVVLAAVSATAAVAQSTTTFEIPGNTANNNWQVTPAKGKLFVVTLDQPNRRQSCHFQSITPDELVCSRVIGGPRTYLRQQVVALILPGDSGSKLPFVLGFNGAGAAAIWGTVVLAATCPICAAATGVAALLIFGAAGAVLIADDQPEHLLYLAPGQQLSGKLGYVER
jgi:hypothetical protein